VLAHSSFQITRSTEQANAEAIKDRSSLSLFFFFVVVLSIGCIRRENVGGDRSRMESEQLIGTGSDSRYFQMQSEHPNSFSLSLRPEPTRIFDQLPKASIVQVSRPDAGDISPMLLSYTIEFQYKQARSPSKFLRFVVFVVSFGLRLKSSVIVRLRG